MTDAKGASAPGFPEDLRDQRRPSEWRAKADEFAAYAQDNFDKGDHFIGDMWLAFSAEMHKLARSTKMRESGDG